MKMSQNIMNMTRNPALKTTEKLEIVEVKYGLWSFFSKFLSFTKKTTNLFQT